MRYKNYDLPSIKTRYGDYHFKSKLEARWAVFMDLLGVSYEYEKYQGIVSVNFFEYAYMPDFFLNDIELFLEIKPRKPVESELNKAAAWANDAGDVVFFYNLAPDNGIRMIGCENAIPIMDADVWRWCECLRCLKVDITAYGVPRCGCFSDDEFDMMLLGKILDIDFSQTPTILKAFSMAKKHDFKTNTKARKLPRRASLL
ncbi:MAG: hypothetical protein ACP59X_10380 [Solidesulfovibrio sp. DCME]|uniref:hypothetical protein n=1 Tax=Solidesulfovibrio sp. DCME TaxID=3447380 RepID=UPI003D0C02E0